MNSDTAVGAAVLVVVLALLFYGGGLALVIQAVILIVFAALVLSLVGRGKRGAAAALMPITVLTLFFPSKRIRSLLNQVEQHAEQQRRAAREDARGSR